MVAAAASVDLALNYPQWLANNALADRRSVFLGWGRGVGKSWFVRSVWWLLVAKWESQLRASALKPFRGVRITVLMPTLVQYKDVHWAGIEQEIGAGGEWGFLRARLDKQRGHITFPGGSWVKPFPASAHNSKTARGMRTDVLCADECDDIDIAVYDGVAVPWLSEPWSLGIELIGGTPTRGRHGLWWRTLKTGELGAKLRAGTIEPEEALQSEQAQAIVSVFENLKAEDWPAHLPQDPSEAALEVLRGYYSFHATYRDAPETVSPLAVAKAKATTLKATFEREWEANPDAGEGLVYPFDENFHVIGARDCPLQQEPPARSFAEFHVGMDHGWVDPGVLIRFGISGHGEDATLVALEESYESEVPNHVWNERAGLWRDAKFWPDPSRPDRINDLRSMGLSVGETDNDILAGVARLANLMFIRTSESGERWARFYVSPKCRNLIRELGLYRRKKLPDGTFDETPEDRHNHAADGTRYVAVGRFGRMPNVRHTTSGR